MGTPFLFFVGWFSQQIILGKGYFLVVLNRIIFHRYGSFMQKLMWPRCPLSLICSDGRVRWSIRIENGKVESFLWFMCVFVTVWVVRMFILAYLNIGDSVQLIRDTAMIFFFAFWLHLIYIDEGEKVLCHTSYY